MPRPKNQTEFQYPEFIEFVDKWGINKSAMAKAAGISPESFIKKMNLNLSSWRLNDAEYHHLLLQLANMAAEIKQLVKKNNARRLRVLKAIPKK